MRRWLELFVLTVHMVICFACCPSLTSDPSPAFSFEPQPNPQTSTGSFLTGDLPFNNEFKIAKPDCSWTLWHRQQSAGDPWLSLPMGDLPLHQELALEPAKPTESALEKSTAADPSPSVPESREQNSILDQAMNPEVRLPDRPRDVQQTQSAAKDVVSRTLKGKEKEWAAVAEKKRPLQLLDLPIDILREIVGHVSFRHITILTTADEFTAPTHKRSHLFGIVPLCTSLTDDTLHIL